MRRRGRAAASKSASPRAGVARPRSAAGGPERQIIATFAVALRTVSRFGSARGIDIGETVPRSPTDWRFASRNYLCHAFALRLYRRIGDTLVIQKAPGHRPNASTLGYARTDAEKVRRAVGAQ